MARTASSTTKMEHVWTRSFQRVPGTGNEDGTYIDEIFPVFLEQVMDMEHIRMRVRLSPRVP